MKSNKRQKKVKTQRFSTIPLIVKIDVTPLFNLITQRYKAITEAYLEPSSLFTMKRFWENS